MENLKIQIRGIAIAVLVTLLYFAAVSYLFFPGDAIFKNDEALFQLLVDQHFDMKTFPLVSFLGSSIPLPYGPVALWFYGAIRSFTDNMILVAFFHSLVVFLGLAGFAAYFSRGLSSFSSLAWITLVISSPLLFLASRQPWDNTLLIPLTTAILILVDQIDQGRDESTDAKWSFLWIGILGGCMAGIHLMAGPFLLCTALALLPVLKKQKRLLRSLQFSALGFLVVMIPYLWGSIDAYQNASLTEKTTVKHFWGDGRNLWWLFQRSFFFLSTWGAKLRFSEVYKDFLSFSGTPWRVLLSVDVFGWPLKLVAIFVTLEMFVSNSLRGTGRAWERILGMALPATLLIYNFLNMPTEPHYFHPIWWMPFLAVAVFLRRENWWMQALVTVVACLNFLFIFETHRFVHRNSGMRSMAYSSTVSEQMRAWRQVCAEARERKLGEVRVAWEGIQMISHPMRYFGAHLPECAGVRLSQAFSEAESSGSFHYGENTPFDAALLFSWKEKLSP